MNKKKNNNLYLHICNFRMALREQTKQTNKLLNMIYFYLIIQISWSYKQFTETTIPV